ncbi:MAG: alginate export family protein [Phycisphaerae bacterium]|nr:alginate export family protein [Phycisphaerae bacterium]
MRNRTFVGCTLACCVFAAPAALAQTAGYLQQQRQIDDKLEVDRQAVGGLQSILDWQWGGWLEYFYFNFSDGTQSSRQSHRPGAAFWTRLTIDNGAHEFFARLRMRYDAFQEGDEFLREYDWVGPRFDRAWYKIDVMRAFKINQPSDPIQLQSRIGRQPVVFGTGYVLDLPLDAALVNAKLWDFRVTGLFAKTPSDTPNIDRSAPVASHSDRLFYGVQVDYTGIQNHQPFAYALWNNDRTDERPKDFLQDYGYDTYYIGIGSRGSIVHNLNYWGEAVYEGGQSFGDGNFIRRDDVSAWALDAGIEYLFDHKTLPRVAFEYMYASGDGDRRQSPTNARGGNGRDREDNSFNAFGFRDTGLALGPTLSNLHIWKWSASFKPFPEVEIARDMELGTNWFLYHKNQRNGAISDFTADRRNGFVGWEMDYFLNWRLMSDVAWTVRWGSFFPGSAYGETDDYRHFLFTGVTWSF